MYNKKDLLRVLDKLENHQKELSDKYYEDPSSLDDIYLDFNQTMYAIDLAYRVLLSGLSGTYLEKKEIIDFFKTDI